MARKVANLNDEREVKALQLALRWASIRRVEQRLAARKAERAIELALEGPAVEVI